MTELDLRALVAALEEGGVRFVLIGGVAVAAHGYVRATEDVDVVPAPSPENVRRLGNALLQMGATLPLADDRAFVPREDNHRLARGESVTLDTRHGMLDIVQRVAGVPGFNELDEAAVSVDLLGVPVRICSLEHLRAMKRARGTHQDLADLEGLED